MHFCNGVVCLFLLMYIYYFILSGFLYCSLVFIFQSIKVSNSNCHDMQQRLLAQNKLYFLYATKK